jgi:DHA1 family inner membrane transport protein
MRGFADTLMLKPLVLALFATFFFQAVNEGLFAFMIGLGRSHNLDLAFISETLGIAGWLCLEPDSPCGRASTRRSSSGRESP